MAQDNTISDAIKQNAAGPKSASNGSGAMSQHSLKEQIEADKYVNAKAAAAANAFFGLRMKRIVPGGGC